MYDNNTLFYLKHPFMYDSHYIKLDIIYSICYITINEEKKRTNSFSHSVCIDLNPTLAFRQHSSQCNIYPTTTTQLGTLNNDQCKTANGFKNLHSRLKMKSIYFVLI